MTRSDNYQEIPLQKSTADGEVPVSVKLGQYEADLLHEAEGKIDRMLEGWQDKRHKLETAAWQLRNQLERLQEQYLEKHRLHKDKGLREPMRKISAPTYYFALLVAFVVEFPFNLSAFHVLRMDIEATVGVAALLTIAILAYAHFLGMALRSWPSKKKHWNVPVLIMVSLTLLVSATFAIGLLRAEYLEHISPETADKFRDAVPLIMVNLLAAAVATMASFYHHDEDEDLERIVKNKSIVARKRDKVWDKWRKTAGNYDTVRGVYMEKFREIQDGFKGRVSEYRDYNSRYRDDGKVPSWFREALVNEMFRVRDFGNELDLCPKPLGDLLEELEGEHDARISESVRQGEGGANVIV